MKDIRKNLNNINDENAYDEKLSGSTLLSHLVEGVKVEIEKLQYLETLFEQ